MALADEINMVLRDFERVTARNPAPHGDPTSGVHDIEKGALRQLLLLIAQTMGDPSALQEILTQIGDETLRAKLGEAAGIFEVSANNPTARLSGSNWLVSWTGMRARYNGNNVSIADASDIAMSNGGVLYIDVKNDVAPYPVRSGTIGLDTAEDFRNGSKIQLIAVQAGVLVGPMAAHMRAQAAKVKADGAAIALAATGLVVGGTSLQPSLSWTALRGHYANNTIAVEAATALSVPSGSFLTVNLKNSAPYIAEVGTWTTALRDDLEAGTRALLLYNSSGVYSGILSPQVRTAQEAAARADGDLASRSRENHTGTQPASTISETTQIKMMTAQERARLATVQDGAQVNEVSAADLRAEAAAREQEASRAAAAELALSERIDGLAVSAAAGWSGPYATVAEGLADTALDAVFTVTGLEGVSVVRNDGAAGAVLAEFASAAQLTAKTVVSRAFLVANLAAFEGMPDGALLFFDGVSVKRSRGAVAIPDLPGWLPNGPAHVKHWGVDTAQDVNAAFQAALLGANRDLGVPLHLRGGATYQLSQNISLIGVALKLKSDLDNPAFLDWTNPTGLGLRTEGVLGGTSQLAAPVQKGAYAVPIASVPDIRIGDIMVFTSGRPWPGAPLAQGVFCGELSRVVGLSGNVVQIADPFNEGYHPAEGSTISFYRPLLGVVVEGVRFRKPDGVNDVLRVAYAYQPTLEWLEFVQAGNNGVTTMHCYEPVVDQIAADRVRTAPAYAVRDVGSLRPRFTNIKGKDNNKLVDLTGFRAPSCDAFVQFVDDPTAISAGSGICGGSHWGVRRATWSGCRGRGRSYFINTRGEDEVVENCRPYGSFGGAVILSENPRGTVVKGNVYDGPGRDNADQAAPSFLEVISPDGFTDITMTDNEMTGIGRRMVLLKGAGVDWKDIRVAYNTARISNASSANALAVLDTTDTTGSIHGLFMEGNDIVADDGQTNLLPIGTAAFARLCGLPGQKTRLGKTTLVHVADGTAQMLLIGSAGDGIEITVRCEGVADFYCHGLLFRDGQLLSLGGLSNVVGKAGAMTGGTGTDTAGKLAVSFTGSRFYVQNRTGAARKVYITIGAGT